MKIEEILEKYRDGKISLEAAMAHLGQIPFADVGCAKVDLHRRLRKGFPEVIYAPGKTDGQMLTIVGKMDEMGENVFITRVTGEQAELLTGKFPSIENDPESRTMFLQNREIHPLSEKPIPVLTAGTADIPVAAEAVRTIEVMGHKVERVFDVGVAGIHRFFANRERIQDANVVVVVAGMDGVLPSVVGGAIDAPVIAVPTSTGYGASFGGIAALLTMLNSCAPGVSVVNIDNGFGAGYQASKINEKASR